MLVNKKTYNTKISLEPQIFPVRFEFESELLGVCQQILSAIITQVKMLVHWLAASYI